jgi:hypothetical protein
MYLKPHFGYWDHGYVNTVVTHASLIRLILKR